MDKKRRKHLNLISCVKRYFPPNYTEKLGNSFRCRYREGEKASEQRVRRAIYQSLNHLASLD